MHIAINAHLLAHTRSFRRAGVSNYVEALLTHLGQIDRQSRYTIYTTRGIDRQALPLPPNFAVRPSRLPTINPRVRIPWEQLSGAAAAAARPRRCLPWRAQRRAAVLPLPQRDHHPRPGLPELPADVPPAQPHLPHLGHARLGAPRTRILAVSEATKQEIVRLLGIPPERIVVTYDACEERFAPPDPGRPRSVPAPRRSARALYPVCQHAGAA